VVQPAAAGGAGIKRTSGDAGDVSPLVAARFERLRAWRAATAREQGIPAYVIAHDTLLLAIARADPRSLAELAAAPGMGPARLDKYGADILQILAAA
jgi:ATP-dependent DNA helicase RecQ